MAKSGIFFPIPCRTLTIGAVGGDVQECRHIASTLAPDEHPVLSHTATEKRFEDR